MTLLCSLASIYVYADLAPKPLKNAEIQREAQSAPFVVTVGKIFFFFFEIFFLYVGVSAFVGISEVNLTKAEKVIEISVEDSVKAEGKTEEEERLVTRKK